MCDITPRCALPLHDWLRIAAGELEHVNADARLPAAVHMAADLLEQAGWPFDPNAPIGPLPTEPASH